MKSQQYIKEKNSEWKPANTYNDSLKEPLVLVFGNRYLLEDPKIFDEIKDLYPTGDIIIGSSAGEILGESVTDSSLSLTAVEFEKSQYKVVRENILDYDKDAYKTGQKLSNQLPENNLKHVFVVSEGSFVNGSALIDGLESIHKSVTFTGGLCGDDARFEKTLVGYNDIPKEGEIIAIGFYGDSLDITSAQYGGWTPFGPERIVTKSDNNILYELDEQPALDLYKKYLGDKAAELPQSALLYPLSVKSEGKKEAIVRTILSIDEKENTMILAGDVAEGSVVQLMMANIDKIAEGAAQAALFGMEKREKSPDLAILVSCIGRKLVMDQRVEEEIEEVVEIVGKEAVVTGFYSYGELAPFRNSKKCELHNQTMTLTLISE
ncbi:FIST signal transduction protein [Aquimarina litoralis]|uniref:FIST signal transduction protein n=1 Tax=Aquimarina litoralis TaxID=584605 RepID=UPI001C575B50|nr:FIST N-terminal domain-containing protein [Aquimarina litoralis]MBW1297948.1 histidine kinase [Aquimarina litoralis]